jgi:Cys-rich repeat protein
MRAGTPAAFALVALALLAPGLGCKDSGVLGEHPGCEPACGSGRICDAERATCVAACPDDGGCRPDAGACAAGRCVACASDSDCPGNLRCDDDRCTERDDDEGDDDDEEEDDDGSGSSGEGESGSSGEG